MSKRFLQGMWLGISLTLWGVVLYTHGSLNVVVAGAAVFTLLGGLFALLAEIDS